MGQASLPVYNLGASGHCLKVLHPKGTTDFSWLLLYLVVSACAYLVPHTAGFGAIVVVGLELAGLLFAIVAGAWTLFRWFHDAEKRRGPTAILEASSVALASSLNRKAS